MKTYLARRHSERMQIKITERHPLYGRAFSAARAAIDDGNERWLADPKAAWNEFYTGDPPAPSTVWPTGEVRDNSLSLFLYCCAERAAAEVYGPTEARVDGKAAWTAQFAKERMP